MTSLAEKKDQFEPARIVYYCKECKKPIQPARIGNKFQFKCAECKNKSVAFGTAKSIANYYHLENEDKKASREEPDEKANKYFKDFEEYHLNKFSKTSE